jgi:hypothetical protein
LNWHETLLQAGSVTGAAFGFVEIIKDHKMMMAKKDLATARVMRYTTLFGG